MGVVAGIVNFDGPVVREGMDCLSETVWVNSGPSADHVDYFLVRSYTGFNRREMWLKNISSVIEAHTLYDDSAR